MTVPVDYPGVYIAGAPSGNFVIAGVATAITAFVGRAGSGSVNQPTDCFRFTADAFDDDYKYAPVHRLTL